MCHITHIATKQTHKGSERERRKKDERKGETTELTERKRAKPWND